MPDSVEIPLLLPNNTAIRVEATPINVTEDADVAFRPMSDALNSDHIESAIEGIGAIVLNAMTKLSPDKATVEFGLEVGLESGKLTALWVKGTGKANLKVTLEWSKSSGAAAK